ncbi:MAG: ribosome silencing factor [Phycisphaerae bacterium]|nr:ribosome silencing factor [Phycisphaerae bacterium]
MKIEGQSFAIEAARIAHDDHSEDVVVLDLRGLSSIADFFIICTGTSDRQMQAVVDHIQELARKVGQQRFGLAGYDTAQWILADYVDVIIHVFDAKYRAYYDLELLWGDAPRLDWKPPAEPPAEPA